MKAKLLHITFILSLLSLLSSCGNSAGKTEAKLSVSVGNIAVPELAGYVGGAILTGHSVEGASFSINLLNAPDNFSLSLDNGSWRFMGFIWDGAGDGDGNPDMEGVVRCAISSADLTGGQVTVALNFNNANCDNNLLAPQRGLNAGTYNFPYPDIHSCSDASAIVDSSGICNVNTPGYEKGYYGSYRFVFETHDSSGRLANPGFSLYSDCYSISSTDGASIDADAAALNIPWGNGNYPLRVTVEAFDDQFCIGAKAYTARPFNNGLYIPNGSIVNGIKAYYGGTNPTFFGKLYFIQPGSAFCNSSFPIPDLEFSGGDGLNTPFAICEPWQFDLIGDTGTDASFSLSANYALLRSIDFRGREAQVGPNPHPCVNLEAPGNFLPVGYDCIANTTGGSFSGNFYGFGNSIINPIFQSDAFNDVGVFSIISGTVSDLKIVNPRLEGGQNVGALAGTVTGTGNVDLVEVLKGSVRSRTLTATPANVGGAVGNCDGVTQTRLFVRGTEIEGRNNSIGGVCGTLSTSLTEVYFNGSIRGEEKDDNTASVGIGGIVGTSTSTGTVDQAISKGALMCKGQNVGGIVGDASANTTIQDSYSHMAIVSYDSSAVLNIGGILGAGVSGPVTNSYFSGAIGHYCSNGTPALCKIGDIAGTGGITFTNTYGTSGYGATLGFGGTDGTTRVDSNSDLRNASAFPSTSFTNSALWSVNNNQYPRLNFELASFYQKCTDISFLDTVANQITNGRGTGPANPISICIPDQFAEIKNDGSKYYKIEDHINLDSVFPSLSEANVIPSLSGTLDGNNRVIFNAKIQSTTDAPFGIIRDVTSSGRITDVRLLMADLQRTGTSTVEGMGALAAINNGVITKTFVGFSNVVGTPASVVGVGGIVGVNEATGVLEEVFSAGNTVLTSSSVGGVAGVNKGHVSGARSSFGLNVTSGSFQKVGGVVGESRSGSVIEKSVYEGWMSIPTSITLTDFGGIVGHATDTEIKDVFTDRWSKIHIMNGTNIGGIAGTMSAGSVVRSYNSAEISNGYCTAGSSTGAETSKVQCEGSPAFGTWNPPTSPTSYGAIIGNSLSSPIIGTRVFYTAQPFEVIEAAVPVTAGVVNGTNCQLDAGVGVLTTGSLAASNSLYLETQNMIFTKVAEPTTDQIVEVNMDIGGVSGALAADCTDLSTTGYFDPEANGVDMTLVLETGNTHGTRKLDLEMKDPQTFCGDIATFAGALDFICSDGYDIIEDGGAMTGFNRLVDVYLGILYDEPVFTQEPVWSIEVDQKRYPEFIRD